MTTATDQLAVARRFIIDTWWQARRYAHERHSYAPSLHNDALAALLDAGVVSISELVMDHGTVWARDADFGWPEHHIAKHGGHNPQEVDQ